MNEKKIQALAEQANLGPCCESQAVAIKKFAELLVRECLTQVFYYEEDEEQYRITESIHERIKEYFGVE